jgi:hypothetical protein
MFEPILVFARNLSARNWGQPCVERFIHQRRDHDDTIIAATDSETLRAREWRTGRFGDFGSSCRLALCGVAMRCNEDDTGSAPHSRLLKNTFDRLLHAARQGREIARPRMRGKDVCLAMLRATLAQGSSRSGTTPTCLRAHLPLLD